MRQRVVHALGALAAASCAIFGCGADDAGDAAADADAFVDGTLPDPVVFTAAPDPAEMTGCSSARPSEGEVRAKHVECAGELVGGYLAMGRVGDLVLDNARVRYIVRSGTDSASTIGAPAGGIVDAAWGDAPDAIKEVFPLFDLASMAVTEVAVVDAGASGEARVRVLFDDAAIEILSAVAPGLSRVDRVRGQLDYVLGADSDALGIEVSISTRPDVATARLTPGLLALLGGVELVEPGYGLVGEGSPGGSGRSLVGERDADALAFAFDEDVGVAKIETFHLMTAGGLATVVAGAVSHFSARLAVGPTAAAAHAAVAPPGLGALVVNGTAGDRVEISGADGALRLRTRLHASGVARVPLSEGTYRVRSGYRDYFPGAEAEAIHGTEETTVAVAPPPSATLTIRATAGGDPNAPVRVVLLSAGEEVERFVAMGPTDRRLPPGDYEVHVSRGLEHDVFAFDATLADGETVVLDPVLPQVVDTSGWVSVDLHLHTELSTDSLHPVGKAVRRLAAEGLDAAASTDHDFITDYASIATAEGVADYLVLVPGVEVSTTTFGHIGGYPLARDPAASGYGAPVWFDMTPTDVFETLRARGDTSLGGALVQVNHPRLDDASFFGAVALDRDTGHATASPMDLGFDPSTDFDDFSFDVIEVWNGYTRGGNEESLEDYLALAAAGRRFTMVGNSDSHLPELPAGLPRTFVRVPDDTTGAFDWQDIAASLRSGDATVSGGIFVTAEASGPPAGDTLMLSVHVEAAPWVAVDRLRIYAGRDVAIDRTVSSTSEVVRVDEVIDVPLSGADFVVVRADGMIEPAPYQHFAPFGITNLIDVP